MQTRKDAGTPEDRQKMIRQTDIKKTGSQWSEA